MKCPECGALTAPVFNQCCALTRETTYRRAGRCDKKANKKGGYCTTHEKMAKEGRVTRWRPI